MEEAQIRKYFLGALTEAGHADFDRWLMTGRDSLKLIEEYEDRLLDDFVHGALSAEDRARFESSFLITPERQGKLRLINNLISESAQEAEKETSRHTSVWSILPFALRQLSWVPRIIFASLATLILVGGTWLAFRYWLSHKYDDKQQAEQTNGAEQRNPEARPTEQSTRNQRLAEETQQSRQPAANKQEPAGEEQQPRRSPASPAPEAPRIVAFTLSLGRVRDEGVTNLLRLPRGTDIVRLMLELERDDYSTYRARLQRADGKALWQKTLHSTKKSGGAVVALIPAKPLVGGEYILSLSGLTPDGAAEEVGNYYFKVEAR